MNYEMFDDVSFNINFKDIDITNYIKDVLESDNLDFNILNDSDISLLRESNFSY